MRQLVFTLFFLLPVAAHAAGTQRLTQFFDW